MLRFTAPILTAAILLGLFLEKRTHARPEDATVFHAVVRQQVEAIPYEIGGYIGRDRPIPEAAHALLKPNATLSRRYINEKQHRAASMLIVQCRETADMSGHYPPVCYPANGWLDTKTNEPVLLTIGGTPITAMRYEFTQRSFDRAPGITIYNFFILPGEGYANDMQQLRKFAANESLEFLGAAQVQVVLDSNIERSEQEAIVADLLTPILPILKTMASSPDTVKP